jgi:hypothetical protein
MQKAGDIAGRALQNHSQRSSESAKPAGSTMMDFLWGRMTEIYGHKWTSSYGTKPTDVWSKRLSALSRDELKRGVMACVEGGEPWPPSLPEFIAMCRPLKRENEGMYHARPMLPAPVSDKETAAANLRKIRQLVRA